MVRLAPTDGKQEISQIFQAVNSFRVARGYPSGAVSARVAWKLGASGLLR